MMEKNHVTRGWNIMKYVKHVSHIMTSQISNKDGVMDLDHEDKK